MSNFKLVKIALLNSGLALAYISLVSLVLGHGAKLFGDDKSVFIPIFMLLLLVSSAAIMGVLVFAKPLMLYFDGLKKEAVKLLSFTIGFLVAITLIFSLILVIIK